MILSYEKTNPFKVNPAIIFMEDTTKINDKIIEKLKKFSKNDAELKFCESILQKELLWFDIADPPFRREFPLTLSRFFPYKEEEQ